MKLMTRDAVGANCCLLVVSGFLGTLVGLLSVTYPPFLMSDGDLHLVAFVYRNQTLYR